MIKKLVAEFVGTAFLLMAIVGSGIMAVNLGGENAGQALLDNSIAVGAALIVLITIFGPVSGAHFNPAVSLYFTAKKNITIPECIAYIAVQILGAIAGTILANMMFELQSVSVSQTLRTGQGQWLAEGIATFGLIITIVGTLRARPEFVPAAVGLYILSAFWFTSSTSFANPAVTIGRVFSDTFAGIAPISITAFLIAQLTGVIAALIFCSYLWPEIETKKT